MTRFEYVTLLGDAALNAARLDGAVNSLRRGVDMAALVGSSQDLSKAQIALRIIEEEAAIALAEASSIVAARQTELKDYRRRLGEYEAMGADLDALEEWRETAGIRNQIETILRERVKSYDGE
jgi:hypothetical protein